MDNHLRVENLEVGFVQEGSGTSLMTAVRSLTVALSREGLNLVITTLIPDEPLQATIMDDEAKGGCTLQIQATRMGFRARILVRLRLDTHLPGSILINVDPHNGWSPLDRVTVGIAELNLSKVARQQSGINRLRSGRYQLDLQSIIRERLLDSSAPVRWDARLDRIDATTDEIRVQFVSVVNTG